LISSTAGAEISDAELENAKLHYGYQEPNPWKFVLIFILSFVLIWFIWSGNLKPLLINKKLNEYVFLSEKIYALRYSNLDLAKKEEVALLKRMDELTVRKSIIDNYLRLQYIDIIAKAAGLLPKRTSELSLKAIQVLRECQKLRPYYTRNWLYVVVYINKYIESTPNINPKTLEELNKEARFAIKRAKELNPKRPDIFIALSGNYLINKEYQEAGEQAEQCLNIAPDNGECWWVKTLSLIGLRKIPESIKAMEMAEEKGYRTKTKRAIGQLINLYGNLAKKTGKRKYYQDLAALYQKLIKSDKERIKEIEEAKKVKLPENFQYHASLAYIYKILGEYSKAREEALIVMELSPSSRKSVEIFLKTLPLK
jgi:tetratricopeptide (TPR) repeat protein